MSNGAARLTFLTIGLGFFAVANAGVIYTVPGSTYTQNFDTLAVAPESSDVAWTNDTTLTGWFLHRQPAPGTAITTYRAEDGTDNTGQFYSYGTTAATDRALGGLGSGGAYFGSPAAGGVAGWIALALINNTGVGINSANVLYNGEQWRDGGNTALQTMVLEYGFGASFTTVAAWTSAGALFDFISPVHTSVAAAVDGNVAGRVNGIGGLLALNSTWANGGTLWLRWVETNDTGNDHGLAIDNFSFASADGVPEPATWQLIGTALALGAWLRKRSR